jgi:hypothetical protein
MGSTRKLSLDARIALFPSPDDYQAGLISTPSNFLYVAILPGLNNSLQLRGLTGLEAAFRIRLTSLRRGAT